MLLATREKGVWVLKLFMFPLLFALIGGLLFLLGLGSIHLVPFSPPFLGALLFWCLASFHEFVPTYKCKIQVPVLRSRQKNSLCLIIYVCVDPW
jgi:amino acid permease